MLKGNNALILNTATMCDIVQQWLDRRILGDKPVVVGVTMRDANIGTFEIQVQEETKPAHEPIKAPQHAEDKRSKDR